MTESSVCNLTAGERRLLLDEVHEALRHECPGVWDRSESLPQSGLADLDKHVEDLVPIVRRSTATRLEPYLAQILDDICTRCPYQQPSAYCSLRHEGSCMLYRCAGPVIAAVRRALREIEIGRELAGGRKE